MTIDEIKDHIFNLAYSNVGKHEIKLTQEDMAALFNAFHVLLKFKKIEQIVMKSPDEFKQCDLKELKQILEVLSHE